MERSWLHGLFQGIIHTVTGGMEEDSKTQRMSYWDQLDTSQYQFTVCLVHQSILFQIVSKQNVSCGVHSYGMLCGVQPSVTSSSLYLTSPQPTQNNKHCVRKNEFKSLSLEMQFFFVFQNALWVSDILMWLCLWFDH
jgi:hypothetical protein